MVTERIEEYLEAIFRIKEAGGSATVGALSKLLKVTPASISEMITRLTKLGLVKHEPHGEITLTEKGEEIGKKVLRKHRVAEELLKYLEVPGEKIHEQACQLEHHLSDDLEQAIHRKIESEKVGAPRSLLPLTALLEGEEGTIELLSGGRGLCGRLSAMGLTPGTKVKVLRSSLFSGPILVQVRGVELALGRGIAEKIWVKRD